ncbi:MAG: glycosyltransferase [Thermoanaerobaculia bacterium]|nr:glycosyltransferase [Thermoanaerobaculia bacterium]
MKRLVVYSSKRCWQDPSSPSGWVCDGGFPLQMEALSQLFDETVLVLPEARSPRPTGAYPLDGRDLTVRAFREPPGRGFGRKLLWLVSGWPRVLWLWRQSGPDDALHIPVPGDVGLVALLLALVRRQRVFVRYCATWGHPHTQAERFVQWLLVRAAGGRRVVLATGGGDQPPSRGNDDIHWIFSTTLSRTDLATAECDEASAADGPKRLISVGRLTRGKNVATSIRALADVRQTHPDVVLDVVGHGPEGQRLQQLAADLGLEEGVIFHGNLDHEGVLSRLRQAHVLVFPTRVAEGFPKAVVEAMACGVPVVAPQVSVLPHLLRDGGGRLIDDVSPAALAAAVRELLDHPRDHTAVARRIAEGLTLEAWRDEIAGHLESAWDGVLRRAEA